VKIIKNILCPIEFTNYSIDFLEYVILLARSMNARLHLLHVITTDESLDFGALNEFFHTIRRNPGDQATQHALDNLDLLKVHIKDADAGKGIVGYAAENEIDMIMMTAHSLGAENDCPLGSTGQFVLNHASCPVMIFRLPEERSTHQSRLELTLQEIKREVLSTNRKDEQ
jgi:nucleotide-binding universal stress UspA family protein